jgi:hypothetical protein
MLITSPAILYYDYVLTLPKEVKFIWSRPRSIPSLSFFVNRYFTLLSQAVTYVVAIDSAGKM